MAEILKEWLAQILERPINWEAEEFGTMMKNGHVIATVLRSYHVINEDKFFLIRPSNEKEDIKNNWKYLAEWLKDVEVNLSEADINSIMDGRGSSLLRLFYQLFLHLDRRDRTNFIKREQKMVSSLVNKMENRFKIDKVSEHRETVVDELSKPLLDEKQFIKWQKRKAEEVKESYDFLRHKYSKKIMKIEESNIPITYAKDLFRSSENEKKAIDKFEKEHPCKFHNYTYEELSELEEKAIERKKNLIDSEWANEFLNNISKRIRNRTDSEEFQRQLGRTLSNSLWNACVTEEENKIDTELAKKVMKLSQFEKQMCTQIMETKQQARNLIKNRIQGEKEYAEQREQQLNIFFDNLKEKITSGTLEIDFEKMRQNELHRKLYAEKISRKRQIHYDICYETIMALVDYAAKFGYFKKLLDGEVPAHFIHEWKTLFFKQQPIFDVFKPIEGVLKKEELSSTSSKMEEVIIESDRQEVLNNRELEEYLDYLYPWNLELLIPNYDPEAEERNIEKLGMQILGHVIYTLLEIKYPYPNKRLPAELPEFSVKALLRGLPDKSLHQSIQVLLNHRKIHVVRLETVINYCLRQYKLEMIGHTDIDLEYDNFVSVAQDEETKEFIKSMKSDEELLAKRRENNASDILVSNLPNTKQTQTPKSLPEDEMTMSTAASLGSYAFEALTVGEPLTDYLLAAMIIEYLKNKNDINGFVIMNYPNNYEQAQILEEYFSGVGPPDVEELNDTDDVLLEESIIKHRKCEIDPYMEVRMSNLVKNPHIRKADKPFKTFFTSYINLKHTSDITQEIVIWDLTPENSDFADRFYAIMGINYSIYYEVVNKDLLARICMYIIGDFSFPIKREDELFGERILSGLDFPTSDTKRVNSKIVKPDVVNGKSREKIRRKSKTSKSTMEMDLEVIKAPHSYGDVPQNPVKTLESMIAHENKSKSSILIETVKVLAGEDDWKYGELPIPESVGTSIITYWEEFEKSYLQKMRQLFLSKRLQMNYVVWYTRFLKDKMNQVIKLPSHKQVLVNEFQSKYNNFEKDWRSINIAKNEWHCRLKELQNKLYKICDERKVFAEQKRYALICDNWTIDELSILANTYISCMQMELNRSIMTFQLFHDFYYTMLKGFLPSDRLSSKDLTKVSRECDNPSGKKGDDKFYKQLKAVFQDLFIKNIELDFGNNPFINIVDNNVKLAVKVIKDLSDSYRSLIGKDYNEKGNTTSTKKKEGNNSTESSNLEEILKQNTNKCFEEWSMGINGEMFCFNLRLLALQYKCFSDMKLFNDQILRAFTDIQNHINAHYSNEILSVDRLCKYIHMAIENGQPIPETLLLEHDTFVIDPNVCQFIPSVTVIDQESKREVVGHHEFRISQLAHLRSQFKIIAPTGLILHRAFIYLLQDFIIFGKEGKEGPLFPEIWKNIDPYQVQKLVHGLFGETAYVDWRDFVIYCLQIPFPPTEELLKLRKKFRCHDLDSKEVISRNDFMNEKLWFESSFEDPLRLNLIKHFLFELFEIAEDLMNYSAFLLAFCKNSNPIKGFVAALSMATGNNICFAKEECGEIVKKLIKDKRYRDESLACAMKCTKQFIDKLIQNVIVTCLGTTVEELKYVETATEDKKSKKGKSGKGKKGDTTQSVRSNNSQKNMITSESKIRNVQSKSKIDIAYPPCKEAPIAEQIYMESTQKQDSLETPRATSQDLNLTYSVDKSVIWNVLKICLPWHFKLYPEIKESPYLNLVQDIIKCLESETDNKQIYVCNLVSHPKFCKFLHKVRKFNAANLSEEIYLII